MEYNLWLDDYRPLPRQKSEGRQWVKAETFKEFKEVVAKLGIPAGVSFDHDLNEQHYTGDYSDYQTGLEAVMWLITEVKNHNHEPPEWSVHTMNFKRGEFMLDMLTAVWPKKKKGYAEM